jgi:hypothetical protein
MMLDFIKEDPVNHIVIILCVFLGSPICSFPVSVWLTTQKCFIDSQFGLGVGLCVYYGAWLGTCFILGGILDIYNAFKS